MLSFLPSFISIPLTFSMFCINLILCGSLIFLGGVLKFIIPIKGWHKILYKPMHAAYSLWPFLNLQVVKLFNNVNIQVIGAEGLDKNSWYLLIANHQSWFDIFVLTSFARNRIAAPKFFLKDSLKKVPFVGMACWALEMPFMKRYSREFLSKNPHLKGHDIETTKKSCQSFREHPTTIINFVEGTRFTKEKYQQQCPPFSTLLTPKAGGIAFTLATLGEQFDKILNITVLYPDNDGHVMKDVLKGQLKTVIVHVEKVDVDEHVIGDYFQDNTFKSKFQQWLNELWSKKDQFILEYKAK